jgi:diguanylate cyclase (GGDEF)-like protein/PAS domain S-box-containing protein
MDRALINQTLTEEHANLYSIIKELGDYKFALDQGSIMATTDANGKITYVNEQFCKVSKYNKSELIGQTHRILNSGYHSKLFFQNLWETIKSGKVWKGDIRNIAKDGSYFWLSCTIIPILDEHEEVERFISIRTDITERKELEEQAAFFAYYDDLTGLPNRRKFNKDLSEKMSSLKEGNEAELSVIFLDLDRFKYINDTKGHTFGDFVLKTVVRLMAGQLCSKARMYRLGGDEFTIIFESSSYREIQHQANRLLTLFKSPLLFADEEFFLSLSIGISVYPFHGDNIEMLVKNADVAMYRAKDIGGNRVEYYSNDLSEDIQKEMSLENELRKGIDREEFSLVYQPKINLNTKQISGLEALIRWHHPDIGLISPAEFIPLAEKTGLIIPISEFVIRTVSQHILEWIEAGLPLLRVAINISPILFAEHNLANTISQVFSQSNITPSNLELEITESAMVDPILAHQTLSQLKALGLHISIDDFGTGYSSLSHLKRFPIDTLKIDCSFIREIGKSEEDDALVKTIIDIAHNLKLNVVAEGIETREQLNFLSKHQCSEGQGYLFYTPMSNLELKKLLKTLTQQHEVS